MPLEWKASMTAMDDAAKEELFRAHIEKRYGVGVEEVQRLDRGVFALNLRDGRRWIARVFPPKRSVEQVEGDARFLQFLEQQGFPAERCADAEPISHLYDRSVLVTNYIAGAQAPRDEHVLQTIGEMLGRLATLPIAPDAPVREAGSLHHYAPRAADQKRISLLLLGGLPPLKRVSLARAACCMQGSMSRSSKRTLALICQRRSSIPIPC